MKKLLSLGSAIAVMFAVASPAIASRLNYSGTITSQTGGLPLLDLQATGGGVSTVNGSTGPIPAHLDTVRLAASRGLVTGTQTNLVTDPDATANGIAAVIVSFQPGTGTLGPVSGAVQSTAAFTQRVLPIGGVAKICLLSTVCTDFLPLVLTQPTTGGGTKGIGVGGTITASEPNGPNGPIRVSVEAAPWTIKTATAVDQTGMGFAHGPASGTTSTAQPSGVLQVVTPSTIRTNLPGANAKVGAITELLVRFIPEPGMLFLLGSGVAGLALLGRNRMKS